MIYSRTATTIYLFSMELIEVQKKISEKIEQISKGRLILKERGEAKAVTSTEYEKKLAVTVLKLKNNALDYFEGQNVKNLPATLVLKVAAGIVYSEKLDMELAETAYKSAIEGIKALESELNALQSILKFSKYDV